MTIPKQLARRYTIDKQIGEGAMGAVYLGTDARTRQPVAVKSLITASTEAHISRFRREGEALARLNHPNIVKMVDMVEEGGKQYIVMEYVPGGDLRQQLQTQPQLPLPQTLSIALELADALTRAHHLNVIHRDIKPANVLLAQDGTPRLSDFGVALFEAGEGAGSHISGTYAYLSPEALTGQAIDERTDIWAFGVMLFEMLAGKRPFTADAIAHLFIAILNQPPPDIQTIRDDVPDDLAHLLMHMLAKEPDARIPSVRLVGAELEAIRKGVSVRSLFAPSPFAAPPPAAPETAVLPLLPPFQAPAAPAHFVGRERVIAEVTAQLTAAERPFVALVGMGGAGKSTAATAVAHALRDAFADGVLWVDAAHSDPMDVLAAWGQAYGFDFSGLSELESRVTAVRSMLAERQALVVLDDVAQISRIRPLLPTLGSCAVLLTTRDQEIAYGLDAAPLLLNELALADSLQLLKRILGDERVDAEQEAAAEICTLLQNLPLAVEIAAQRLKLHRRRRLRDMARRLQDTQHRLGLAISDQAVRTSFTLSWQALDLQQQRLFSLLAVFAGRPFTPDALAHVADLDLYTTEDMLFALTSLSLVKEEGTAAYRQHPLLADFAREKLADPDTAYRQMTGYYYTFAQEYAADYDKLRPEWENIAAAIAAAHQQQLWPRVLAFADVLTPAWKARGRYAQARAAYRLAHDAAQQLDDPAPSAHNLLRWGEACIEQNDYEEAEQLLKDSLAAHRQQANQEGIARAQDHLARIALEQNRYEAAETLLAASQAIWEAIGEPVRVAGVLFRRARLRYNQNQFVEAMQLATAALTMQQAADTRRELLPTLRLLAQIPVEHHQDKEAVRAYGEQALQICEELSDASEKAATLFTLTNVHRRLRNLDLAFSLADEALPLLRKMGLRRFEAFLLFEVSILHELKQEFEQAMAVAHDCIQIAHELDDAFHAALFQMHLGDLYEQMQQPAEAKKIWLTVSNMASQMNHASLLAEVQTKLDQLGK